MRVLAAMSAAGSTRPSPPRACSTPATRSSASTWRFAQPAATAARVGAGLLHHRGRRRRPPGRRPARHPVLRLGPRPALPARTSSRTSWPSTPPAAPPTPACAATRRSSSPRCSTRRSRSASTPSPPATTPGRRRARRGRELHRAVDAGQGPVLRARRPRRRPARARASSRSATRPSRRCARRPRRAGFAVAAQARQPRHLLHPRRRHPRLPRPRLGERAGRARRRPTARSSARTRGAHGFTVGQRRGLGLERSRRSTAGRATSSRRRPDQHRRHRDGRPPRGRRPGGRPPALVRPGTDGRGRVGAQVRAHGEEVPARGEVLPALDPGSDGPASHGLRHRVRRRRTAAAGHPLRADPRCGPRPVGGALRRHPRARVGHHRHVIPAPRPTRRVNRTRRVSSR